ncbi:hypothetical protein ASD21_23085 [Caulobacter sp. Root1455]|jgi:hypothetical protein|uniref:ribonuclease domain-containing protein n=1 Tax=Caulobacter sp. Root1455 TaxID=1736465 RepID=UPI0006F35EFE|nr:ribonuclease domain-containing protein [Caulobacter sp. Root1455]KQY96865.1 hypothetical protein ASD21_23085 [Caulobacter sp. Root1455]
MKIRMMTAVAVALCVLSGGAAQARATIKPCGALGKDALEVARNFKSCVTSNVACAAVAGRQAFGNAEKILPAAAKNQAYQEARVGADRAGAGGVRRLVFLVGGTPPAKQSVVSQYYSDDHYRTFCLVN